MSKKNSAAIKATATRNARREFIKHFGQTTFEVVSLLVNGYNSWDTSELLDVERTSVSAIKANLTRGTYNELLKKCNL